MTSVFIMLVMVLAHLLTSALVSLAVVSLYHKWEEKEGVGPGFKPSESNETLETSANGVLISKPTNHLSGRPMVAFSDDAQPIP